jgi:hypothetical protein
MCNYGAQIIIMKLFPFNAYASSIITVFLLVVLLMGYWSKSRSIEEFIITLPIIIITICWSKNASHLIKKRDIQLSRNQIIKRDIFLIFYSFISTDLIYLLFQYNNIDKGWWPLSVYCMSFYGLIFGAFFSATSLFIGCHRIYSIIFSLIIFSTMLLSSFLPYKIYVFFIGEMDMYIITVSVLALTHLLICSSYAIKKLYDFK